MTEKVNYSDLLKIGFVKVDMSEDCVHQKQYGYPYFILAYGKDNDQVCMEWSPVSREVNLYLNHQIYQTGLSLEETKRIVEMLEAKF
jgi:hypothetical protein